MQILQALSCTLDRSITDGATGRAVFVLPSAVDLPRVGRGTNPTAQWRIVAPWRLLFQAACRDVIVDRKNCRGSPFWGLVLSIIHLRCDLQMDEEDVHRILAARPAEITWEERPVVQHPDITDVAQTMLVPVIIAGVTLPSGSVVYGVRTLVLTGEERGRMIYDVCSVADHVVPGRTGYSASERKHFLVQSKDEMAQLVLAEYKRFLQTNLP